MDFGTRAYNHSFHIDPVVRDLMDTDFYKFLMLQFIHYNFPRNQVTFRMINRTKTVRISDEVPISVIRAHLDHVKNLRFNPQSLVWLAGNMFYGQFQLFKPEFIEFLRNFRLPDYELTEDPWRGQYILRFHGDWEQVTLWEIYAITIVNELRYRAQMQKMSKFELDIMYSKAKSKLWDKLMRLANAGVAGIADFGTRRRHSFLWQEWAVQAAAEALGKNFIGTSNTLLAMKHGYEAIGTNAHELPMVLAALAQTDKERLYSQYKVLELWQDTYGPALQVFLPDTYGTTQFLKNAPEFVRDWVGMRVDSKDPARAAYEYMDWLKSFGIDPREKRVLFSDGLDVDPMIELFNEFKGKIRAGFGWGTLLTNDFVGCHPHNDEAMKPISLVCKVEAADGVPACKLSDNYTKATGPKEVVDQYRALFGTEGMDNLPVVV